jgi:gamma-glutamyltranspeptidase/glutathione hydrolase
LLAPAIRLARDGFPAGENLIDVIGRQRARLARSSPGWDLLNSTLVPGSIVRQEGLAATLEEIAQHGGRIFYEGDIADAIVRAAGADGSALSREDLATHATVQRDPLQIGFGDATVFCQPPVSQAAVALMALKRLDALGDLHPGSRSHVAIEAIDAAFLHRDELVDVGAAVRLLATELDIDLGRASRRAGALSTAHTTAVATADGDGLVVSMLISIFDEFGCATLVPEGGFFLNDRMLGFARDPASPNAPAHGKRPIHTLSPLVVVQRERVFAAATPGADGQVQTLTQLIDGILTEGLSITAALDRRRWRASDGQLLLEEGFRTEIAELLAERGHLLEWRPAGDRSFGAAVLAGTDLVSNSAFAAADLRREAWAGAC